MTHAIVSSNGLVQLTHAEVKQRIAQQQLFGLDKTQASLFRFCKLMLTADQSRLSQLNFYNLSPSVLLYGPPNTGKTTLCYLLFDQLKQTVTKFANFLNIPKEA